MANIPTKYNAKDTVVTVNGVNITGFGENMITWEKQEDYFTPQVGAQGDVVKSIHNNDLYTLTISVQSTCPQLKLLMSIAEQHEFFPIWCVNKPLGLRFGGSYASVQTHPNISLGADEEDFEFTFVVFDGITDVI